MLWIAGPSEWLDLAAGSCSNRIKPLKETIGRKKDGMNVLLYTCIRETAAYMHDGQHYSRLDEGVCWALTHSPAFLFYFRGINPPSRPISILSELDINIYLPGRLPFYLFSHRFQCWMVVSWQKRHVKFYLPQLFSIVFQGATGVYIYILLLVLLDYTPAAWCPCVVYRAYCVVSFFPGFVFFGCHQVSWGHLQQFYPHGFFLFLFLFSPPCVWSRPLCYNPLGS